MGYGKEGRSSLINGLRQGRKGKSVINGLRQGRKGGAVINELKQGKKGAHLSMGYGKEGRELTYQWVMARKEGSSLINGLRQGRKGKSVINGLMG